MAPVFAFFTLFHLSLTFFRPEVPFNIVRLPINSRMTDIFQDSDLDGIVDEMFDDMKTQIKNPALRDSGFRFNEILYPDVSFYQLN